MKILALNGSPTMHKGMTHILLQEMLTGAKEAGAEVESVFLQKKKIHYCLGCYRCWLKTPGVCVHKDDMPDLLEKVREADCVVLATPLYVDGMTAQTKTFIDRLIPLGDPHFELIDGHYRHVKRYEHTPDLALVSVCGFYERDNFDGLIDHAQRICKNLRCRFAGALVRPSSYIFTLADLLPDAVAEIRQAARTAGRELVEQGTFSPATLDAVARDYLPKQAFLDGSNRFWDECIERGVFPPLESAS